MSNNDYGVGIIGLGKCLPKKLINSEDVEKTANLPAGDIEKKTGVKTRFICEDGDTASGLSALAATTALEKARVSAEDLDIIIGCTSSGDYKYPAMACKIHDLIKAKNAGAFDMQANCTSFTIGLSLASDRMHFDPTQKNSLVVGTAIQSRYLNWEDGDSAMYFGDGAAAAVIGQVPKGYGIIAHDTFTNSRAFEAVRLRGGGSTHPLRPENIHEGLQYQEINGMEVWKQVVQNQPKSIKRVLEKAGKTAKDVDFFIFHQANLRLIEFLMAKMKLDMSKTFTNVGKYGNTAEASIPLALCEAVENNKIKRGDLVLLSGVGAGFTFGSILMKWY